MKTLSQFKNEEKVDHIDLLQGIEGNKRAFATVNNKQLIVSSECDLTKPLFVIEMTKDANGNATPNVYLLINSKSKHVASV